MYSNDLILRACEAMRFLEEADKEIEIRR